MSVADPRNFSLPQKSNFSRKPLPQGAVAPPGSHPPLNPNINNIHPDQVYLAQHQQQQQQQQQRRSPQSAAQYEQQQYTHSRSRTASSSVFPQEPLSRPPQQSVPYNPSHVQSQTPLNQYAPAQSRRTLSNATTSTSSSTNWNNNMPSRQNSGASSHLHRSTSSTSSNSPTSYVALMRKQKATVWSDRTQHEDPRTLLKQRVAKERALREVKSTAPGARVSTSGGSSITGGVRSKIRHGAPKAQQYAPGTLSASGVPVRLSQNEIDEDDDDESYNGNPSPQHRTGSGRSSLGSSGRVGSMGAMPNSSTVSQDFNSRHTTTNPSEGDPSPEETPVPGRYQGTDYFDQKQTQASLQRAGSGGSSSTGRENSFGGLGKLPERPKPDEDALDPAELRRRGSVDERTMTMSGYGKLFVANPDVDN